MADGPRWPSSHPVLVASSGPSALPFANCDLVVATVVGATSSSWTVDEDSRAPSSRSQRLLVTPKARVVLPSPDTDVPRHCVGVRWAYPSSGHGLVFVTSPRPCLYSFFSISHHSQVYVETRATSSLAETYCSGVQMQLPAPLSYKLQHGSTLLQPSTPLLAQSPSFSIDFMT